MYEKPVLKIIGRDGNAFAILGEAKKVLKQHGYDKQEIEQVMNEAMAGDYNNLLQTMLKYFDVEYQNHSFF